MLNLTLLCVREIFLFELTWNWKLCILCKSGKICQFGDFFHQNNINFCPEGDNDETNAQDCVYKTLGAFWSIVRLKEGFKTLEISFILKWEKACGLAWLANFVAWACHFFKASFFQSLAWLELADLGFCTKDGLACEASQAFFQAWLGLPFWRLVPSLDPTHLLIHKCLAEKQRHKKSKKNFLRNWS